MPGPKKSTVGDLYAEMYGSSILEEQRQEEEQRKARKMREGLLPKAGALVTRLGTGIASGIVGSAFGVGTAPAAAIGGGGEALAQWMESADPLDQKSILLEGGLSAVPMGGIVKALRLGKSVPKQVAANMLRNAGIIEAGNISRRAVAGEEHFGLPDTWGEGAFDAATAVGLGGLGGYVGSRYTIPKVNAKLEAEEAARLAAEEAKNKDLRGLADAFESQVGFRGTDVEGDKLVGNAGGRVVRPEDNSAVLRVLARKGVIDPPKPQDTISYPAGTTGGALTADYRRRGVIPTLDVNTPRLRRGAAHIEESAPNPGIAATAEAITRKPFPNIDPDQLDSQGLISNAHLALRDVDEARLRATQIAKPQLAANRKAQAEEKALAKAEAAADTQYARDAVGGTNLGKIKAAEEKAAAQALKERVDAAKAETTAADMRAKEKKAAAASRAIEEAERGEGFKPGPRIITESVAEETGAGKRTLKQSFIEKLDEEGGDEVPAKGRPVQPTGGKGKQSLAIPVTDATEVASKIYVSREAAMHAAAGSGKRVKEFKQLGKGQWTVVFEDVKPTPKKVTELEDNPIAAAMPKAAAEVPPVTTPKPAATPEANAAAKAEAAAEGPVAKYSGTERRSPNRIQTEAEDLRYRLMRESEARKNAEAKAAAQKKGPDAPPADAAPVPAKPKPTPKTPKGGAAVKPAVPAPQKPVETTPVTPKAEATPAPAKPAVEAPEPPKQAVNRVSKMKKRDIDAVDMIEARGWTAAEIKEARIRYPKDKRLMTILNKVIEERKAAKAAAEAPKSITEPVKPTVPAKAVEESKDAAAAKKADAAASKVEQKVEAPKAPEPEAKPKLTADEVEAKYPRGAEVRVYGDEGQVLTHGPNGVRVRFKEGTRMAKEQGNKGYFDVDHNHIESVTIPERLAEVKAATRAEVKNWSNAELDDVVTRSKDKGLREAAEAELAERAKTKGAAPIAAKAPEQPAKAAAPITPKSRGKAKPAQKEGSAKTQNSYEKMATESNLPAGTIKLDVSDVKDGKGVAGKIVSEIQKFKARVQVYEDSAGVNEKGVRSLNEELNPGALSIHIPGGPTLRFQPDMKQLDAAAERLEKNADAFTDIVKQTKKGKTDAIPTEKNWGSPRKPTIMTQADSDKLGREADIIEHDKLVGPKAATEEFTPKGATTLRTVDGPDKLPATATHAVLKKNADGSHTLIVSDDPKRLTTIVGDMKDEVRDSVSYRKNKAVKRDVKEGTLPEGKTWAQYLTDSKFDTSNVKFAVATDEVRQPLKGAIPAKGKPPGPDAPPTTPAPKGGKPKGGTPSKGAIPAKGRPSSGPTVQSAKAEDPKGAKQASPLVEAPKREVVSSKPAEGTSNLVDLASREKDAWDNYFNLRNSGADPAEVRAAAEAAGRLKAETLAAVRDAVSKGEPIPTFLEKHLDQVNKQAAKAAPKKTIPPGKGPTSDDLTQMEPEAQEAALKDIVNKFKGKKGDGGTTLGSGFGGMQELLSKHPIFAAKIGSTTVGAIVGAGIAEQNDQDPLTGALLGASALGVPLYAPSVFRALAKHVNELPAGSIKDKASKQLGEYVWDKLETAKAVLPDYYRASLLSNPVNLGMNALIGPYGSAMMFALERAMMGDKRGISALKELANPIKSFGKPWASKEVGDEARKRLYNSSERGDLIGAGSGRTKKLISLPAEFMTRGDISSRQLLMRHGFSEVEARAATLTSEPMGPYGKGLGDFRKRKVQGKHSLFAQMALPFYRTNVNQFEQSIMRFPIIGSLFRKSLKMAPREAAEAGVQGAMSMGVLGASYFMGQWTDKKNERATLKLLNNFTGPYGITASLGFMAGVGAKKGDENGTQFANAVMRLGKDATPMPTIDSAMDLLQWGKSILEGEPHKNIPHGFVPGPVSSRVDVSIPNLVQSAKEGKLVSGLAGSFGIGSGRLSTPTKEEYLVFRPIVKDPELKDLPKSESEIRAEKVKAQRSRGGNAKERREALRRRRAARRNALREAQQE